MNNTHGFGVWLRRLRTTRNLTQETLADAVGCAAETIRSFENGRRRPSRSMASRLADKLQVAPDERETFIRLARATEDMAAPADAPAAHDRPIAGPRPWAQPQVHLPPDALIGRRPELERLRQALLDDGRRLVTLLGPGGIGKTRLALQIASDLAPNFAGQAIFVPLAPVASTAQAVITIAEAVGCLIPGGQRPEASLIAFLRERRLLLLLDNLEHLLGPQHGATIGALLTSIVREAPRTHLLITSRERLKLRGEWVVELNGLSLPSMDAPRAIDRSEAVLLFLDRARQVAGHFALGPANRQAIARICRMVGGAPLAIELAAGWTRALTCDEIATEIARSLDFLAMGDRDLPPRHQSLRAVVEHSWQLLGPAEQRLLMRLSVLRGGGQRDAIAAVAKDDPGSGLLPTLAALVDKSLVRRTIDGEGATRYDLHELVRQYVAEQLAASPIECETRARHAAYYAAWVAQHDQPLKSARQQATIRAITAESDNIRIAWRWACEQRDAARLRQMLLTLDWFYELRGWHAEAAAAFGQAHAALRLEALRDDSPSQVQSCYWLLVGREGWHVLRHDPGRAVRQLQTAVDQLRQVSRNGDQLHCIKGLAYLKVFSGDYAGAATLLDEGSALAAAGAEPWQQSVVQVVRAVLEVLRSDPETARAQLHTALAAARTSGDPRHIALTLNYLGVMALSVGQTDEAEQACRECLVIAAESHDRFQMSLALQTQGQVALSRGDVGASAWLFDEGLRLAREIDDRWLEAQALERLGTLAAHQGNRALASAHLRAAVAVAATAPLPFALDALARIAEFELDARPVAALTALAYVRQHPLTRPGTRAAAEARWQRACATVAPASLAAADQAAKLASHEQPAALGNLFDS